MLAGLTFLVVAAIPIIHARVVLDEDMYLYWRRSEPSQCEPFTTRMVDCNKCVCSADGVSYCTRMACFMKDQSIEKEDGSDEVSKSSRILFPFTSKQIQDETKVVSTMDTPETI